MLRAERATAMRARVAVMTQVKAILVTAPEAIRAKYRAMSSPALMAALEKTRPAGPASEPLTSTATVLKRLAVRYRHLHQELALIDAELDAILALHGPMLRDLQGVGTDVASQLLVTVGDNPERVTTEAKFAALVGVAPIPASSGKTTRHRLSRGGDRNANHALYQVVLVRMASCQRTKDYVAKRPAEGKSKREIMRCLSNRSWLVWCLLAGWLPVLLGVTPAASGPSGSDGAFRLTCPSGGAGAGLSSSDGLIEGRPGCHL